MITTIKDESQRLYELLEFFAELISSAYLKAVDKNMEEPVVFLLDLDDSVARSLAVAAQRDDKMENFIKEVHAIGGAPFVARHMSAAHAARLLERFDSELANVVRRHTSPEGSFTVVVIAYDTLMLTFASISLGE